MGGATGAAHNFPCRKSESGGFITGEMNTLDARELLRRFAEEASEEAFAELVARFANLVHSVAIRRTGGDRHLAQDIAQKVFADLARQGGSLPADTLLGGWLHRHTCFVASTVMRSETRR